MNTDSDVHVGEAVSSFLMYARCGVGLGLDQRSREEKDTIVKASFDKKVEKRVQEEKERHWLIDEEVQRQMTNIIPTLKRTDHMSVPSSGSNYCLCFICFLSFESFNN